ncbi:ATP-binding protein [Fodinibius salsisoli]|uniref:ATP-binding protein n=1 Tax=Fodinibius salsisoli TaxID=2820877 RepID=A0ABT3PPK7_9BACT|nr:ATP-binding protein [Fodinibius salsisoli]MCW9707793.1 ATP-binding protein [Fodinibius salsisoli]
MSEDHKKELILRSSFEEMEKLESFVNKLQNQLSFSDAQYNRILLPLSEAVSNAIMHGNKQDPGKKVTITAKSLENKFQISVRDEGGGFDPSSLPDPLKEENLLNQGGRGVYLIKEYADEVSYSDGGAKITMRFILNK